MQTKYRHGPNTANERILNQVHALITLFEERLCMMGDQIAAFACSVRRHPHQNRPCRELPVIPMSFYTLRYARDCIEGILAWGHDHVVDFQDTDSERKAFHSLLQDKVPLFQQALDSTTLPAPPEDDLNLLRVAALNGMVLLLSYPVREETDFDSYNTMFGRIMHLVTELPSSNVQPGRVSFGIDCGLIDIVAFIGSRCREPGIRHRAFSWLRNSARFEGERLSSVSAQIISAWISLEEGKPGEQPDAIPELHRRRLVAGERYHDQGLIKLIFSPSPYVINEGARMEVVWLETVTGNNLTELDRSLYGKERPIQMPDVIFGPGHAAFLDHEKGAYHHLHTRRFHCPVPRA